MKYRKLLSVLLALALMASLLPAAALAADTTVTTWNDLAEALATGGTVKLGADVTYSIDGDAKPLEVPVGVKVTLDLNGHTLAGDYDPDTYSGDEDYDWSFEYLLTVCGELTLVDESESGGGAITGGWASNVYVSDGAFTMYGGTITGAYYDGVEMEGGTFAMYGGEITGNVFDGVYMDGGAFTLHDGVISDNGWRGVCVLEGDFTMHGGEITGNRWGGAVLMDGTSIMNGGEISGNGSATLLEENIVDGVGYYTPWGYGVKLYGDADFTMNGGAIRGNACPDSTKYNAAYFAARAYSDDDTDYTKLEFRPGVEADSDSDGVGVYADEDDNSITINDGVISGNGRYGVYADCAPVTMTGGEISGNGAAYYEVGLSMGVDGELELRITEETVGDGVFLESADFTMEGGSILNNKGNGVNTDFGATLLMTAGAITGNAEAGVNLEYYSEFTMTAGTISGSSVGVSIGEGCAFDMSGGAVKDNDQHLMETTGIALADFNAGVRLSATDSRFDLSGDAEISGSDIGVLVITEPDEDVLMSLLLGGTEVMSAEEPEDDADDGNGFYLSGSPVFSGNAEADVYLYGMSIKDYIDMILAAIGRMRGDMGSALVAMLADEDFVTVFDADAIMEAIESEDGGRSYAETYVKPFLEKYGEEFDVETDSLRDLLSLSRMARLVAFANSPEGAAATVPLIHITDELTPAAPIRVNVVGDIPAEGVPFTSGSFVGTDAPLALTSNFRSARANCHIGTYTVSGDVEEIALIPDAAVTPVYYDPGPAQTSTTADVTVNGETHEIKATVSGGVLTPNAGELTKLLASLESVDTLELDLRNTGATSAVLPKAIANALGKSMTAESIGLALITDDGALLLNAAAVSNVMTAAAGDVTLGFEKLEQKNLNANQVKQLQALENIAALMRATILVGSSKVHELGPDGEALMLTNVSEPKTPNAKMLGAYLDPNATTFAEAAGRPAELRKGGYSLGNRVILPFNGVMTSGTCSEYVLYFAAATDADAVAACDRGADCPLSAFTDVDPDAWYHNGIHYVLTKGWMQGLGDGIFDPNGKTTRAMAAMLLWNMEGKPAASAAIPFADVADDAWYAKAVRWAAENGVVEGWTDIETGKQVFAPDDYVTREQFAAMLYRYARLHGQGFLGLWGFQLDYPDVADVSDWALEAMTWLVMKGVINGLDGRLQPQSSSNRAQIATMVYRYDAIED